jgi:hypothetical protein
VTGTWLLAGSAIGLTAAIAWGLHRTRQIYETQYQRELARRWPLESDGIDIPAWVNQGNRACIGQYEEILAAIRTDLDVVGPIRPTPIDPAPPAWVNDRGQR